ncbi:uncharacterized protein CLUP02_08458 [Colletotrichum lupini]|uniref:Uncharacterized protein n=1 Tax=Colletotrichum lupini TaxID=145971 RepID=A0A9Q8STL0_9PEZI|nr:uncharacterized protein CLUP02_08458 [Colletotrichum lupini]UQC82968.1 hypothetical protein CLUP02_08458 [Colletotrichum lupini]
MPLSHNHLEFGLGPEPWDAATPFDQPCDYSPDEHQLRTWLHLDKLCFGIVCLLITSYRPDGRWAHKNTASFDIGSGNPRFKGRRTGAKLNKELRTAQSDRVSQSAQFYALLARGWNVSSRKYNGQSCHDLLKDRRQSLARSRNIFIESDSKISEDEFSTLSHRLQIPFTPLKDRLSSQLQGPPMNTSQFDSQAHPMSLHNLHPQTDPRYVVPPDYTIPNVSPGHPQDYYQSQGPKPIFQPHGPNFRTESAQEPLLFERPPPDQYASNIYEDAVYFDQRENDFLDDDSGTRSTICDFQYTNDWAQNRLRNPPERSGQSSRDYPRKSRGFEHDDPRDRAMSSEKGPLWSYRDISRTGLDTAEGWRQQASFGAPQTREERHSEQKQEEKGVFKERWGEFPKNNAEALEGHAFRNGPPLLLGRRLPGDAVQGQAARLHPMKPLIIISGSLSLRRKAAFARASAMTEGSLESCSRAIRGLSKDELYLLEVYEFAASASSFDADSTIGLPWSLAAEPVSTSMEIVIRGEGLALESTTTSRMSSITLRTTMKISVYIGIYLELVQEPPSVAYLRVLVYT